MGSLTDVLLCLIPFLVAMSVADWLVLRWLIHTYVPAMNVWVSALEERVRLLAERLDSVNRSCRDLYADVHGDRTAPDDGADDGGTDADGRLLIFPPAGKEDPRG